MFTHYSEPRHGEVFLLQEPSNDRQVPIVPKCRLASYVLARCWDAVKQGERLTVEPVTVLKHPPLIGQFYMIEYFQAKLISWIFYSKCNWASTLWDCDVLLGRDLFGDNNCVCGVLYPHYKVVLWKEFHCLTLLGKTAMKVGWKQYYKFSQLPPPLIGPSFDVKLMLVILPMLLLLFSNWECFVRVIGGPHGIIANLHFKFAFGFTSIETVYSYVSQWPTETSWEYS